MVELFFALLLIILIFHARILKFLNLQVNNNYYGGT